MFNRCRARKGAAREAIKRGSTKIGSDSVAAAAAYHVKGRRQRQKASSRLTRGPKTWSKEASRGTGLREIPVSFPRDRRVLPHEKENGQHTDYPRLFLSILSLGSSLRRQTAICRPAGETQWKPIRYTNLIRRETSTGTFFHPCERESFASRESISILPRLRNIVKQVTVLVDCHLLLFYII